MTQLINNKEKFINAISKEFGQGAVLSRSDINNFATKNGYSNPSWLKKPEYKVGHGQYKLPTEEVAQVGKLVSNETVEIPKSIPESMEVNLFATHMEKENLIPSKFKGFVPWGHYSTIKKVVQSGMFYPVFITGLSGNGKTLMVEQLHAENKKN